MDDKLAAVAGRAGIEDQRAFVIDVHGIGQTEEVVINDKRAVILAYVNNVGIGIKIAGIYLGQNVGDENVAAEAAAARSAAVLAQQDAASGRAGQRKHEIRNSRMRNAQGDLNASNDLLVRHE